MYKIFKRIKYSDDEIVEIIPINKMETYDIEVDSESKLFLANDIVTHNTAWNSSNVTMGDIAESAGLAHTADTIFAIIQDNDMLQNNEYWLKILKIRDGGGKNTKCLFQIDYSRMRITETNDVVQNTI